MTVDVGSAPGPPTVRHDGSENVAERARDTSARSRSRSLRSRGGAASPRAPRLGVDDWLDAAFALLVSDGVAEVKITRLCEQLGVTKGSFYWHFADIDELMTAIADRWVETQNEVLRGLMQVESMPVAERLQTISELLVEHRTRTVEAAIREWARTNARVADAVRELDQRIFDLVRSALLDWGFGQDDARLRAGLLVYAGIGFVHAGNNLPTPTRAEIQALFRLVVGDEPA